MVLGKSANSNFATLADVTVDAVPGAFRSLYRGGLLQLRRLELSAAPAERYTAGSFLNYDVNDYVNVYSEFMFARNTSSAAYGPSGEFAFGTPTISCDPPVRQD